MMESYFGSKLIKAEPANKGVDEGYFVEYPDGYTSWSPKAPFELAYRKVDALPFGLAIEALKQGHLVDRAGWPKGSKYLEYIAQDAYQLPTIKEIHANGQEFTYLIAQIDALADDWRILK